MFQIVDLAFNNFLLYSKFPGHFNITNCLILKSRLISLSVAAGAFLQKPLLLRVFEVGRGSVVLINNKTLNTYVYICQT